MARSRSISTIDAEIEKTTAELVKLQGKQDVLSVHLLELQKTKQEYETKKIMDAFHKSDKSLQELMTFLDV